ncbi:hypothetical protein ACFC09_32125 [Streptomyces sp. NPDC056161]|uniref:hypothetical protein n=1 Tax=Streptomyces sp. NPDC056161 TaxID=3345732 RepID=UPI0035DAECAA
MGMNSEEMARMEKLEQQVAELMKKQQNPQSQPQTNGQNQAPAQKQPSFLEATGTSGSALGQAQATLKATLTDQDGMPIVGQRIMFRVNGRDIGSKPTDSNGEAVLDSGSHLGDPVIWAQAILTGYEAIYRGSPNYLPAEAKGKIQPAVSTPG